MMTTTEQRPPATSHLAGFLAHITLVIAIALPLFTIAIWMFWDAFAGAAAGNLRWAFDLTTIGPMSRLAGFIVALVGALAGAYGLLGLRTTFLEARQQRALSADSLRGFRRFAWVSLFLAFYGIIQHTALVMVFSIADPEKPGALSIQIGSIELKAIFSALLLVFVASVFAEAKRAKDENDGFI